MPEQPPAPPPGVVQVAGEWYYEEFRPGFGVAALGMADAESDRHDAEVAPPMEPRERRNILNLFMN